LVILETGDLLAMQKPDQDALSEIIAEREAGWRSVPSTPRSQPDSGQIGRVAYNQEKAQQAIRERMLQDTKGSPPNQALSPTGRVETWHPVFRRQTTRLPEPSSAQTPPHRVSAPANHNPIHTSISSQGNIPNQQKAHSVPESILLKHPHLQAPVPVKSGLVEIFLSQGYRRLNEHRHPLHSNKSIDS
jgi:hypothetical protein